MRPSLLHLKWIFNPEGIESSSPGLRGTSYPGLPCQALPTLKGLRRCLAVCCAEKLAQLFQGWNPHATADPG